MDEPMNTCAADIQSMQSEELLMFSLRTSGWRSLILTSPASSCTNSLTLEGPDDDDHDAPSWGFDEEENTAIKISGPLDSQDRVKKRKIDDMQFAASAVRKAEEEDTHCMPSYVIDTGESDGFHPKTKRMRTFTCTESSSLLPPSDSFIRLPPLSISIEEAVEPCSIPRAVVLASPPFTVVHVNAAYTNLTGVQSNIILGQPFCATPKLKYSLRTGTSNGFVPTYDHLLQANKRKNIMSSKKHMCIRVSPVSTGAGCLCRHYLQEGGIPHEKCTTHFAIDIVVNDSKGSAGTSRDNREDKSSDCYEYDLNNGDLDALNWI